MEAELPATEAQGLNEEVKAGGHHASRRIIPKIRGAACKTPTDARELRVSPLPDGQLAHHSLPVWNPSAMLVEWGEIACTLKWF